MSKHVTIQMDSRAFYLAVALLGVVGIVALSVYIGMRVARRSAAPATTAVGEQNAPVAQPTLDPENPFRVEYQQPQEVAPEMRPGPPISPDEVPVGEGEPRLWLGEPEETQFQFRVGQVPGNDVSIHEFKLSNIGKGDLEIYRASASCGCTIPEVDDNELAPGESTVIRVTYDPRVLGEQGQYVEKTINIKSNDPKRIISEFTIVAEVESE